MFVRISRQQIEIDIYTCSGFIIFIQFVRPLSKEIMVD